MADQDSAARFPRRTLFIGIGIVAAFLAGFLLQFGAARQARSALQAAEAEAAALRQQVARGEVRDLAALLLYEVTQRNFGTAAQHSTALFDRLQQMAAGGNASEPLRQALEARDRVTAGLASADTAVLADVQRVFQFVHQATSEAR